MSILWVLPPSFGTRFTRTLLASLSAEMPAVSMAVSCDGRKIHRVAGIAAGAGEVVHLHAVVGELHAALPVERVPR